MKILRYILIAAVLGAVVSSCGKKLPESLNILTTLVNLPADGGTEEVSIMTNTSWSVSADQPWLHFSPSAGSGSADYQLIKITADKNEAEAARQATVTVSAGSLTKLINVSQAGTPPAPRFTIRDFRAKAVDKTTWYTLTGEIASIANEQYGNFYMFDDTDSFIYVYGLCEKQVASNDQSFSKLGLKVGDSVTIKTLRSEYNGAAQAGGTTPAYFVSKTAGSGYKLGSKVASTKAAWMELPATSATDGQDLLIHRFTTGERSYAAYYDYNNLVSTWVAYPLCAGNIGGSAGRTDSFSLDPLVPRDKQALLLSGFRAGNATGSFDRGHQLPSADRNELRTNMETFFSTNITPQDHDLNGGIWVTLENKVRAWAKNADTDTLYVVTGCFGADAAKSYVTDNDGKHVAVPTGYYKALLRLSKDKKYTALGIWFNNEKKTGTSITKEMVTTIDALEEKVKVDFFVNLPDDVEKSVEAQNPKDVTWWWNN